MSADAWLLLGAIGVGYMVFLFGLGWFLYKFGGPIYTSTRTETIRHLSAASGGSTTNQEDERDG